MNLTVEQRMVLEALAERGEMDEDELVRYLGLPPRTIAYVIEGSAPSLVRPGERIGLALRIYEAPDDDAYARQEEFVRERVVLAIAKAEPEMDPTSIDWKRREAS